MPLFEFAMESKEICSFWGEEMNSLSFDYCLGYLKFTLFSEGENISEEEESLFSDILKEDISALDAINKYLKRLGLKSSKENIASGSFYVNTRCPVNFLGIKDRDMLDEVDLLISSLRTAELFNTSIESTPDLKYYLGVHKSLFSDLYPDAGKIRNVDLSKRTDFVPVKEINGLLDRLFAKLKATDYLRNLDDDDDFINELSYVMSELEAIHPFLDGNGRTTRFFITHIAHRCGYEIDWINADPDSLLEASISAIDGDNQPLIDLLEEITYPVEED